MTRATPTLVARLALLGFLAAIGLGAGVAHADRRPALTPFEQDGKFGFKDRAGKVAVPAIYHRAEPFGRRPIAEVVDDQGLAWLDAHGRVVARPFNFDNGPDAFVEGRSRIVDPAGKLGFLDERGQVVIPPRFTFVRPFAGGRAAFCVDCKSVPVGENHMIEGGRWGYIDLSGREVIAPTFDAAGDFDHGHAEVRRGDATTTIDRAGHRR